MNDLETVIQEGLLCPKCPHYEECKLQCNEMLERITRKGGKI